MGLREAKKEARRAAIDKAGLELFLEEGYDRCSVERIAGKVGMARGTFYLYYEDKAALFEALAERLYGPMVAILEQTAEALSTSGSITEHRLRYLQMAGSLAGLATELRPLFMLHFRESRSAGPAGEAVGRWMARIETLAASILQDAQDRGILRDHDAYVVSQAIIGSVERLTWDWLVGSRRFDKESAAIELSAVFFQGIAPDPEG